MQTQHALAETEKPRYTLVEMLHVTDDITKTKQRLLQELDDFHSALTGRSVMKLKEAPAREQVALAPEGTLGQIGERLRQCQLHNHQLYTLLGALREAAGFAHPDDAVVNG